jgi:hypothetical protein
MFVRLAIWELGLIGEESRMHEKLNERYMDCWISQGGRELLWRRGCCAGMNLWNAMEGCQTADGDEKPVCRLNLWRKGGLYTQRSVAGMSS